MDCVDKQLEKVQCSAVLAYFIEILSDVRRSPALVLQGLMQLRAAAPHAQARIRGRLAGPYMRLRGHARVHAC